MKTKFSVESCERPVCGKDVKERHHQNCKTVSKEELKCMISEASVPPAEEFRCAVHAILNHPSIPLCIFPSTMRLLNSAITSKDKDIVFAKPFCICRKTARNEIHKSFPVPKAKSTPFNLEMKDKEFQESSLVVFDIKEIGIFDNSL